MADPGTVPTDQADVKEADEQAEEKVPHQPRNRNLTGHCDRLAERSATQCADCLKEAFTPSEQSATEIQAASETCAAHAAADQT